ncbi:methionine ABC transporter ATP-binding protein [Chitinilyticum litopenaei]|uniref:Cell division ATP-binding protein FtsE n=2 Tax=Chitinilyticum piscinae TaxID=2866724 RepID=A0A8J7FLW8_9NEIS|nr:methionine ABC transporter ATP-binding protein [Chitinilyticum piscinae]
MLGEPAHSPGIISGYGFGAGCYNKTIRLPLQGHPLIALSQIHKSYRVDGRDIPALNGIDLTVAAGEIFGIIGHSGAGKSTLIRLINLLERPSAGSIRIDGADITALDGAGLRSLRQQVGMIFQHFNLLGSKTVARNIAFPLEIAGQLGRAEIDARVDELLELVGLAEHKHKYPSQLSGGQKQRVGIARALANRPKVLLCDEATSALDPQTTQSVLQLLAKINRELNLTIVLITHEMDVIRSICDRVAVIDGGKIVEMGPVTQVFLYPQHPTTQRFVSEAEHIDETAQAEAFAHVPGKVVRMTFIGETTYEGFLGNAAREFGIDFSILSGRIERIKDTPCGQMLLAFTGCEAALAAAFAQFRSRGIDIEELR